jgi:para-nitrobenzyl esterase
VTDEPAQRVVATEGGRVSGSRVADGVVAFLGIPYAAPPFGAARLLAPQPAMPWDGVRPGDRFGPVPPQPAGAGRPAWPAEGGDDVLSLNVWVPEAGGAGLPVLTWIYGGEYTRGAANGYDPSALVRAGLVAVTLNYRVGVEGFAHVPGAPDNRGLLDQVAALRWVQDNIAAFGGDPGNVTVAGESAGAGSAVCLAVMPAAAGLLHRAIAHSVPSEFYSPAAALALGARVAGAAGAGHGRDELAAVPAGRLVEAGTSVLEEMNADPASGQRYYVPTIFNPVVDGEVLPVTPLAGVTAGAARGTGLLLCHTTEEFRLFSVRGVAPQVSDDAGLAAVAAACGLPGAGLARYRELMPDAAIGDVYAAVMTDFLFAEYTIRLAEAAARAGGAGHLARFAWRSRVLGGALGACHGADVPFCFGTLDSGAGIGGMVLDGTVTEAERGLSERMVAAWAGFAADGDPGWPAVTGEATPVRVWAEEDRLAANGWPTREAWKGYDFGPTEL